jgi:hypothetical protein
MQQVYPIVRDNSYAARKYNVSSAMQQEYGN